ncbi:MAG: hypothetical protein E7124_07370 [Bacteroidales bacterium]|nr:hypothetical protein [Bacteroidales bacterium]
MKKLILIISMALASSLAFAQNSNDNTLYIIDGVVATKAAADELPSETIRNMNVVKGIESVVVITTHAGREISGRVVDVEGKPMAGVAVVVPKTKLGVVTGIDGIFNINLPAGEAFLTFKMIDFPSKTVQVDKADLGDIVMDKNAPENLVVIKDLKGDVTSVRGEKMPAQGPLCIIKKPDGEISKGSFDSITPEQIKSIHVFKDNSVEQFKKYGDTSNGVILVELK